MDGNNKTLSLPKKTHFPCHFSSILALFLCWWVFFPLSCFVKQACFMWSLSCVLWVKISFFLKESSFLCRDPFEFWLFGWVFCSWCAQNFLWIQNLPRKSYSISPAGLHESSSELDFFSVCGLSSPSLDDSFSLSLSLSPPPRLFISWKRHTHYVPSLSPL